METRTLLRLCVLGVLVYVVCGNVVPDADTDADLHVHADEDVNMVEGAKVRPERADRVVHRRPKRGFRMRRISRGISRVFRRRSRRVYVDPTIHIRQCQATCWASWKPWGSCSLTCGRNGVQYRTRDRSVSAACAGVINAHGCPGSSSMSRACTQQCQNGGTLGATSCSCPPGFKNQCCQTRVTCGFPGKPSNGGVSSGASTHAYNARVTYSCNTGYRLQGAADNTCQNTESWKNSVPTCARITCSKPGLNAHVSVTPTRGSYDHGARVVYACPEGYRLQGAGSAVCTGAWSHPSPTCQAITCPALTSPDSGSVSNRKRTVGGVATYTCNPGYHLSGSRSRTCQVSGRWDGTTPTCTRVTCPRLSVPANGKVNQPSSAGKDQHATYSCNTGYELRGNQRRTCNYGNSATGTWSGSTPSCSLVSCGAPSTPAHVVRIGTTFTHGSRVEFRCEAGHYLVGAHYAVCEADKSWSHNSPRCNPCRQNQYKVSVLGESANAARVCTPCPAHTHTTSTGSTRRAQCVCNHGYEGSNGGPCNIVKCPALVAPSHGVVGACALNYQSTCSVTCAEGYIRHGGDETRTCLLNKKWSGTAPTCKACPKNTYKSGPAECTNCPVNSATVGEASSKTDCVCKTGFRGQPGERCEDINECASNNGGCVQICTNQPGTYACACRSGYVRDAQDGTKCVAKNSCPALDRPSFGGLVCLARVSSQTERCSVKCNHGYQHILRPNQWEECGPSTNFRWTTEANMTPILGCIESFFDEISIDGEAAYFTTSCDQVTGSVRQEVQQAFVRMLKQNGICTGIATCSPDDVTVTCGPTSRKRRDVTSAGSNQLNIKFKVKVPSASKVSSICASQCDATRDVILYDTCYDECEKNVEQQREAKLAEAKSQLRRGVTMPTGSGGSEAGSHRDRIQSMPQGRPQASSNMFGSGGLLSRPAGVASVSDVRASCDVGMERRNNTCVPCAPGSYLRAGACVQCSPGQYQPRSRATTCMRCEDGKHSPRGATACTHAPTEEPIDFFVVIKPGQ